MAKVLVAESIADAGVAQLRDAGHEVAVRTGLSEAELLDAVADVDALVIRSATKVTADVLAAAPKLKVVGRAGIGLDNVDLQAATRQGVMVVNAPQSNAVSAAEHTIALILAQARNVPQAHGALRAGRWERKQHEGTELYGKTLGVLGLGRIGSLVAHRLHAFGMRVLAYDPYVSRERAAGMDVELADLDDVVARADVLTVHLPRTPETIGLVGAERLAHMKPGARVVNVARGGIVDEQALADAVTSGHLGGAAVDVFVEEPTTESPLFGVDRIVVTPHLGASTAEAQDRAGITVAEQLLLALDGQFVPNAVNVDAGPVVEALRPYLPLAEQLGRLYTALAAGGPGGQVTVEYLGTVAEHDTRVLTLSVLRGVLAHVVAEPVTFVNARLLADERGVDLTEVRSEASRDYVSQVVVSGPGPDGRTVRVAGTVTGPRHEARIVSVDDLDVDLPPAEHMVFLRYEDRPGVIGTVGSLLGDAGVNIGSMQVGRHKQGGEALMTLTVDHSIPPGTIEAIIAEIGAHAGTVVDLDDPTGT